MGTYLYLVYGCVKSSSSSVVVVAVLPDEVHTAVPSTVSRGPARGFRWFCLHSSSCCVARVRIRHAFRSYILMLILTRTHLHHTPGDNSFQVNRQSIGSYSNRSIVACDRYWHFLKLIVFANRYRLTPLLIYCSANTTVVLTCNIKTYR